MQFSKRPKLLKPICGNDCNYFLRWMSSQKRLWWRVLADQPEAFHYHYVLFKARACHDNQNWQLMTFLCCTRICIYICIYIYVKNSKMCLKCLSCFIGTFVFFSPFRWPFRFCPFHEVGHPLSEGRRVWYHIVSGVSKMERCRTVKVEAEHI